MQNKQSCEDMIETDWTKANYCQPKVEVGDAIKTYTDSPHRGPATKTLSTDEARITIILYALPEGLEENDENTIGSRPIFNKEFLYNTRSPEEIENLEEENIMIFRRCDVCDVLLRTYKREAR